MPQDATPMHQLHATLLQTPSDNAAYTALVMGLLPAEAERYLQHQLEIPPDHLYALHQRAAMVLSMGGLPSLALIHYQQAATIAQQQDQVSNLVAILPQLTSAAVDAGRLARAENSIRQYQSSWEQIEANQPRYFRWNGMTRNVFEAQNDLARVLVLRGEYAAAIALLDSIEGFCAAMDRPAWTLDIRARAAFWRCDLTAAAEIARVMWPRTYEAAMNTNPPMAPQVWVNEAQLHAEIALAQGDLDLADKQLTLIHQWIDHYPYAFRAEKIALFTGFGMLAGQRGQIAAARDHFATADALIYAGEYPLLHADLLYAVAQLEREMNQPAAAIQAATQSYQVAWCDGIAKDGKTRYTYQWGLDRAAALLTTLGAPIPTAR